MMSLHINILVYFFPFWIVQGVYGQNEICMFYNLHANCRYRIDAVSLSHIQAEINQCADPIEVTFIITNERPRVDFKHTFNSADTLVSVPRFTIETQLRVRLTNKKDDVINIEADFYVYGQARADFINEDIKLNGLEEHCPILNSAAKIAIGVMGGLAVIAAILILVLVYIRNKRKKRNMQARNQLVANAAEQGISTPAASATNIHESHMTSQNTNTSSVSDRVYTDRQNGRAYTDRQYERVHTDGQNGRAYTDRQSDTQLMDGQSDRVYTERQSETRLTDEQSDSRFKDRQINTQSDSRFTNRQSDSAFAVGDGNTQLTDARRIIPDFQNNLQPNNGIDVRFSDILKNEDLKRSDC